jgi:hypothetical protein
VNMKFISVVSSFTLVIRSIIGLWSLILNKGIVVAFSRCASSARVKLAKSFQQDSSTAVLRKRTKILAAIVALFLVAALGSFVVPAHAASSPSIVLLQSDSNPVGSTLTVAAMILDQLALVL